MSACGGVQGELFDTGVTPPPKPRMAAPPAKAKFIAYRPAGRVLCDDCIRDIHLAGQGRAPFPATVRYRCTMPDGSEARVCDRHRQARMT